MQTSHVLAAKTDGKRQRVAEYSQITETITKIRTRVVKKPDRFGFSALMHTFVKIDFFVIVILTVNRFFGGGV